MKRLIGHVNFLTGKFTPLLRSRLLSVGIGLRGQESHTYAVPVFSKQAFYKLNLSERFFENGNYWRKVVVKIW